MLEELLLPPGEVSSWSEDEYIIDCPFCYREKKFTWNLVKKVGKCWVCDKLIVGEQNFKYRFGSNLTLKKVSLGHTLKGSKFQVTHALSAWEYPFSRSFLLSKNLDELTVTDAKLRFSENLSTLFIDTYSISPDHEKSYLWRKIPKGSWFHRKGTKGVYYCFNFLGDEVKGKNILITEGIFDLLSTRLYKKGIAVLGSSLNDIWYYWIKKYIPKVTLWFDPDGAGQKATNSISEKLKYHKIPYSIIKSKLDPKCYTRNIKAHKDFLEALEEEIDASKCKLITYV